MSLDTVDESGGGRRRRSCRTASTAPPLAGSLSLVKPSKTTRARAGALALTAVIATAGCSFTSPFQTDKPMSLGDGVMLDLGNLEVRNLAIVTGKAGDDATLTGTVGNTGSEDATLQVLTTDGAAPLEAKVPANTVVTLSTDGEKLTVPGLDAAPGSMTEVAVGATGADLTPVSIPVLDPAGYYEDYAPEGWTPAPTPSASETESAH